MYQMRVPTHTQQISDKPTDHFEWTRPEDMNRTRRAYKVSSVFPPPPE